MRAQKPIDEMTESELIEYGYRLKYLVDAAMKLKPRDSFHQLEISNAVGKGHLALIKTRELYRKKFKTK